MENNTLNDNEQKQFEFKLLRKGVKANYDDEVAKLRNELNQKIKRLEIKRDSQLLDICKKEDAWRQSQRDKRTEKIVTPYTDDNGKKWVRVKTGKFDFILDIDDMIEEDITWYKANTLANEVGYVIPNKNMWHTVAAYLEEINGVIKQLGGHILDGIYWASEEYYGSNGFLFDANHGTLINDGKVCSYRGRISLVINKS